MQQMFLKAHHQRMHPRIKDDVRSFPSHLRRVARGNVLHMERSRNHRTGHAEALGNMPLHLRAEHQFGCRITDSLLDFEIIIANQRLEPHRRGRGAYITRHFTSVRAHTDHVEAELFLGHARRADDVRAVAKDVHPLSREVRRVDAARIPGKPRGAGFNGRRHIHPSNRADLAEKLTGRTDANRDGLHIGHPMRALQPAGRGLRNLRIQRHVEVRLRQPHEICRRRAPRGHHMHLHAHGLQQGAHFAHIVAATEAERGRAQDIRLRATAFERRADHGCRPRADHRAHEMIEGL